MTGITTSHIAFKDTVLVVRFYLHLSPVTCPGNLCFLSFIFFVFLRVSSWLKINPYFVLVFRVPDFPFHGEPARGTKLSCIFVAKIRIAWNPKSTSNYHGSCRQQSILDY